LSAACRDNRIFDDTPKLRSWQTQSAQRPSVKRAVPADYPELLYAFLVRYDAHLVKLAA
jgi:glutathione S-transferase